MASFELVTDREGRAVWDWLKQRAGCSWAEDARCIGLERDRVLVAAVGYDGFQGGCCQMHVAIDGQITKSFLKAAFHWPFNEWGLNAVLGLVTESNADALRFDLHLGFKEVYRVRGGGRHGEDLIVLEMRREDCRFIGG